MAWIKLNFGELTHFNQCKIRITYEQKFSNYIAKPPTIFIYTYKLSLFARTRPALYLPYLRRTVVTSPTICDVHYDDYFYCIVQVYRDYAVGRGFMTLPHGAMYA